MEDVKQAMTHLSSLSDGGGAKFATELVVFCREFRPATSELRRLLMVKMCNNWAKISAGYPENDVRLADPDWAHNDNAVYRVHITDLCKRIEAAFPVRLDMSKISSCKQEDDESIHNYLTGLTEVHNTHSGLTPLADLNNNAVTAWEAHLRKSFLNGLKPDISNMVKRICITWDSGKLSLIEAHAVHAVKILKESQKRKGEKKEKEMHMAALTMFQGHARGCGRGRGRGGPRGGGQRKTDPDACFHCGERGHWAKDCPKKNPTYKHKADWGGRSGGGGISTFDHTYAR
eukprot:superscaffoldBa00000840_g7537